MKYFNVTIYRPGEYDKMIRRVPASMLSQCGHGQTWFVDSDGNRHEVVKMRQVAGSGAELSELASSVYGSAMGSRAADRLERGIKELMSAYIEERRVLGYTVRESVDDLRDMVGESPEWVGSVRVES